MTIDQLGRPTVESELRHFRWALQYAKEVCSAKVSFGATTMGNGNEMPTNACMIAMGVHHNVSVAKK
jgi:hypothetical protein